MKNFGFTLVVFTIMNFVLAMTASVFTGILDQVAATLNVSVANAGLLNGMYAYGAAFGVPISLIAFRKIERIKMLKLMLLMTILMTFALVLANHFIVLLLIRFIMGVSANSYAVLAITTVMSLAVKGRQGRSLSILIMGNSLALVIGIPLTRALSSWVDWRGIFWALNGIMILSLIYFSFFLPEGDHETTKLNLQAEWKYFKDGNVLSIIATSLIMFIGYNALYNYVTPYLLQLFPAAQSSMSIILLILGLSSFTGNLLGGHVSDRIGYAKSMQVGAVGQVVSIVLLLLFQKSLWLSVVATILWLLSAWFTGLQLNVGITHATHNRSSFMISINSSAIQLGFAVGSNVAAFVISASAIQNIVWVNLIAGLIVVVIQFVAVRKQVVAGDGSTNQLSF